MKYFEKNEFIQEKWEGPTFKLRKESWGPTFKFWRGSRVLGPRVPRSRILGSCSYIYTMSGMLKFLALTLYLLARIILTLICSSAIIVCFQKVNFQRFNLLIWNFELPSAFLYALVSYSKNCLFYVKK